MNVNLNMDQLFEQVNNLSPYERTSLLRKFLNEYELDGDIYCCFQCQKVGSEVNGRGHSPVDFADCHICGKVFCETCAPYDDTLSRCVCDGCKERQTML